MSAQFDKVHATTVIATAAITANRFVSYEGKPAATLPTTGLGDSQGIAEESAAIGDAVSVVTGYSYLVEASAAISAGAYVKPAADGSGKAMTGSLTDHCARALGAATAAGQLVEVQITEHVHA